MNEALLMAHVALGVFCIVASVWVFVDVLNAGEGNQARIRIVSRCIAAAMWGAFVIAGYWYVKFYPVDKAIILKGRWPFAHSFFMETKEHLVIILLLLTNYLPIAAANNLAMNPGARKLLLWTAALVALLGLAMEGEGAIIAMGVKVSLLPK
jgi:hypothetical protein